MKICVYAICKNELKFVDKWLENMSEADYICVLDTGSTDGTYEKLKEDSRVTKVEQKEIKPWRFDVARNESMKLVPEDTDVYVCTDFDELFEKGWAEQIRNNWKVGEYNRGFYTYAWSHSATGEPQDVFKYDKIHTKDFHWIFPVHEVLMINEGIEQKGVDFGTNIYLHHYQDLTKERKYYFDLLELSCKENPNDSHTRMLLAREYLLRNDNKKGLEEFLKVLKMPDIDKPNKRLVLLNSLLQVALIYEEEKNFDEAIWYCQEFIKEDPTYREPYFLMGEMYNIMKMYTLAEGIIKIGFEYGKQHYDWVERGNTWLGWGNDLLGVAYFKNGKLDDAKTELESALKHDPNNVRILRNYSACLRAILDKQTKK